MDLSTGREVLADLCHLLADPHELYRQASTRARRALNKVIFTLLYFDGDEVRRPVVVDDDPNEGVAPIVMAAREMTKLVGTRLEGGTVTLFGETYEHGVPRGRRRVQ